MNNSLFQSVQQASIAAQLAADNEGRANHPYHASVSNNEDPLKQRRIKVVDPLTALETTWLRRLVPCKSTDDPLPTIGSTVLVLSIDGLVTNGWYLECLNDTNPPLDKIDPQNDAYRVVAGAQNERTDRERVISVGESLTLQNDAGASIELAANGNVVITDSVGNSMTLAGGISFSTSSLRVDNKEIATVGAPDTGGDTLTDRGW